ncbi:STAS domain-containing protein [Actinomadura sp. DC4]|uniref:STAS domain-containing protein n=1 Tax=Actinomadura sp. DC4 TaxID=3055069 RepID=UPI0025B03A3A|nr:STAS domain-containing protein [Actinomadura sp. DC4]MDN3359825.1 STAS domain-containing protein [Actinomadura sp. DC4]
MTDRSSNGYRIVVVAGELDISTAPALRVRLVDSAGSVPGDLVVDLSAVTFIDICGLSALVWADQRVRRLRLAAPSMRVARLLAVTHLDLRFALYLTTEAATR